MKRTFALALAAVLAFSVFCEAGPLDDLLGFFEGKQMNEEKSLYTENDMVEYALARLEEKYHVTFEIEPDGRMFGHQDGNEKKPLNLRAYGHPVGNEEERFFVIVTESGGFRDNYWVFEYQNEVAELVKKDLEAFDLEADIEVDYPATEEKPAADLTAQQLIYDPECILFFEPQVDDQETQEGYVPVIRQWMRFLYGLDYNWYLEVHRKSDQALLFTLDPGDNGFKSEEDWSDERIAEYIRIGE